ncbi:hypothetical protein EHS13_09320 [Paenibacillus psychroresistens]|uniref:CoA synthetase n=1 Tax=Paenibacillus psychroresistens TaxID=1778678 RepID=A0A6B8RI90_9BACL|nr:CoA-transferase [Paenibacillus psychroresistens]QGQ95068.1 hypothetical protein EHS13_09320 [Paenibacillus psychroresistens]
MTYSAEELMICSLARELRDRETIAVGNHSPIPAAAALLALATHAPKANVYIIGDPAHWPFEGTKEFFDWIQQGRVDVFFLGGAQIDSYGSINLHVIGDYESPKIRLPGGAGSAMVYYRCKRILLFKTDHQVKGFPEKLDFTSSHSSLNFREEKHGLLEAVITPLAILRPSIITGRLELTHSAPEMNADEIQQKTGFDLNIKNMEQPILEIVPPSTIELHALRTKVRQELKQIYPEFTIGGIRHNG